jgi:hypothetical protein
VKFWVFGNLFYFFPIKYFYVILNFFKTLKQKAHKTAQQI